MTVEFDASAFVADPELVGALEKRSMALPCDSDRVLFRQGESADGIFILRGGKVTLTMSDETNGTVMSVETGTGSLLGLPGLIGNQPYSLSAVASRGSEVRFVSRDQFTTLMQSDPQLAIKILQVLAAEVRSARRALY